MKLVSPSLLSADFGNLQRDIDMLNQSDCDWLHVVLMFTGMVHAAPIR